MAAAANPAAGLPTGSAREKLRSQTLGPVPIAGSSGTGPIFAASTGPPMRRGFGLVGAGARAATLQPTFERVAVGTVELQRRIEEGARQQLAVVVGDSTAVEQGKGGAVRVVPGGSRYITKKKTTNK